MKHTDKKNLLSLLIIFGSLLMAMDLTPAHKQVQDLKLRHEAIAINIEVPVRVFKGDVFIDNLSLEDFELYDNEKLQNIEAVYLIKKKSIEKEESQRDKEVYLPGDTLNLATPVKTYNLSPKAITQNIPNEEIKKRMKLILRRDIRVANGTYNTLMRDLEVFALETDAENYMRTLRELQQFRYVDLSVMEGFASYLKAKEGQKHVFFLYQQENIPLIGDFAEMTSANVEIYDPTEPEGMTMASHRGLRHRDITEDVYNYYSPSDYKTDGKFRNIKVRVKGKNYRINHRAGYIAD